MLENYQVMKACIEPGCSPTLKSASDSQARCLPHEIAVEKKTNLTGSLIGGALYRALAVSELNASMVGSWQLHSRSCGILPAAVLTLQEEKNLPEESCVMSLFTASAIGMVIAANACLARCPGRLSGRVRFSSAMAAAAIVELCGGSPDMIDAAVSIALKNILGLVCGPVAGLVEIPALNETPPALPALLWPQKWPCRHQKCHSSRRSDSYHETGGRYHAFRSERNSRRQAGCHSLRTEAL